MRVALMQEYEKESMVGSASVKAVRKTTQKDIAIAADVSVATVSMAMADSPRIPDVTKKKILKAAMELNYQVLQKNKASSQKVEQSIGLLVDVSKENAHMWNFVRVITEALSREMQVRESSFVLLPVVPALDKTEVLRMITRSGVSGVISFIYAEEAVLTELEKQGIPVVLTFNEQRPEGFLYVGHDDFQGAYEAAVYLLQLKHRRIAYVYAKRNNLPFLQSNRFVGFKKALDEWGVDIIPEYILNFAQEYGEKFRENILAMLKSENAPTAFFCLDDNIAALLMMMLEKEGYRIPEDVSIIAHGDSMDYSSSLSPQISTMSTDIELSSNICCNILFKRLKTPYNSYSSIKTREVLVERGSCAENRKS